MCSGTLGNSKPKAPIIDLTKKKLVVGLDIFLTRSASWIFTSFLPENIREFHEKFTS